MDRETEEFETFLRQFRPRRPRPLPTRRRVAVPLAAAAVLLLGVAISMRGSWSGAGADDPQPTAAPIESGAEQTNTPDAPDDVRGGAPPQGVNPPAAALQNTPDLEFTPALEFPGSLERDQAFPRLGAPARQDPPLRVRVGEAIRPPTKLFDLAPVYPDEAQVAGEQGVVILEAIIGVDGSVIDAQVVRSIPLLNQAALDAVYQWIFEPTFLYGEPVEIEMTVTINFTLSR